MICYTYNKPLKSTPSSPNNALGIISITDLMRVSPQWKGTSCNTYTQIKGKSIHILILNLFSKSLVTNASQPWCNDGLEGFLIYFELVHFQ